MEDFTNDIDALFNKSDNFEAEPGMINILYIGSRRNYDEFEKIIKEWPTFKSKFVENVDAGIIFLLQEVFSIVILDQNAKGMDVVATSRIVRINHPLARIVVFSRFKRATFIIDIINQGDVDAFFQFPLKKDELYNVMIEQQAKHDINLMMTSFISQPPKLSKASYLLLDPSLSTHFDEKQPARFVGIMISHYSVPKYSTFFEDLLAKDEVLFASFLSGITIIGNQLFSSTEPLKKINFGGISVIFYFHDDLQVSIFTKNLTSHNFAQTEEIANTIINELVKEAGEGIASTKGYLSKNTQNIINRHIDKFREANDATIIESEPVFNDLEKQLILIIGSDKSNQIKIKKVLERHHPHHIITTQKIDRAYDILRKENCSLILLDENISLGKDILDPFDFAEHAKEIKPNLQIIYRVRDLRQTSNLLKALNSGLIDYVVKYKQSFKKLSPLINKALEKSNKLRMKSVSSDEVEIAIDKAVIAKTIIRTDEASYRPETNPILLGIFVAQRESPIFHKFWPQNDIMIEFDKGMMAGLVAALDNVGEEMFYDNKPIGGLELGGAKILVQQREDYNFVFFVKHIDPHTSIVVNKELILSADSLYTVIIMNKGDYLTSSKVEKRFNLTCEKIKKDFSEKFG